MFAEWRAHCSKRKTSLKLLESKRDHKYELFHLNPFPSLPSTIRWGYVIQNPTSALFTVITKALHF